MPATFPEVTPATLTGAEANYHTVTTGKKAIKFEIWLTNTGAAAVTVTLYLAPNGQTGAVANQVYADSIPAKRTVPMTITCNLGAGGTLRGLASTSGVVSMRVAPVEI